MAEFDAVRINTGEFDTRGLQIFVGLEDYPRILINNDGFFTGDGLSPPIIFTSEIDPEVLDEFVTQTELEDAISDVIAGAPGGLDTLNELAAALTDDPDFATNVAAAIGSESASRAFADDEINTRIDNLLIGDLANVDGTTPGYDGFPYTLQFNPGTEEWYPDVLELGSLTDVYITDEPAPDDLLRWNPDALDVGVGAFQQVPLSPDLTAIANEDSSLEGVLASDGAGWFRKTYDDLKTALNLVKADVGLGSVDNTSDLSKPISTATQTALNAKQASDTDLTTIAALDSTTAGALVTDGAGWIRKTYAQLKTALVLVKADVGLSSVDNTSDLGKPVSTATQTALNLKQDLDTDLTTIAALDSTTAGALVTDGSGWFRKTYAQLKTALSLVKADVGLSNVDNTSDSTKNSASVTLTNKTIVASANTISGLSESNMDSASDAVIRNIRIGLDGGGSVITTGAKVIYVTVPYNCLITRARLLADQVGSIVIDIWKDTYANFPPTIADTITASAKPTLSSAQKSENTTLVGWTTALSAGDILEISVDSVATVTKVFLDLTVRIT